MPPDYHVMHERIQMGGPFTNGRFGWFFPTKFVKKGDLPSLYPYTIFSEPNTTDIRQFVFDKEILNDVRSFAE